MTDSTTVHSLRSSIRPLVATLALTCVATAQTAWTSTSPMAGRHRHEAVLDPTNGRVFVIGGEIANLLETAEIWSWDGTAWTFVGNAPFQDVDYLAVHDGALQRIVVLDDFGHCWEWDGAASWTPAPAPPVVNFDRAVKAIAYDGTRSTTVLVVHSISGDTLQTFERIGASWQLRSTMPMQLNLSGLRLVPEPATGQVLLIGADPDPTPGIRFVTARWNGATWTFLNTATVPPNSATFEAGVDPVSGNVVMLSGSTWAFTGTDWLQIQTPTPPTRWDYTAFQDPLTGRFSIHGGISSAATGYSYHSDLHAFDGSAWSFVHMTHLPRLPGQAAHDRAAEEIVLLVADTTETLVRRGGSYRPVPCVGTCPTWPAVLAYDEARGETILAAANGTFVLRSGAWVLATAQTPPVLLAAGAASDGQRVILFGGRQGTTLSNETWAWDGNAWTRLIVAGPPGFVVVEMAGFPSRRGLLLAGSSLAPFPTSAFWWWDASTAGWRPAPLPGLGRIQPQMAWLAERDRIVKVGGLDPDPAQPWAVLLATNRIYEFDGAAWSLLPPTVDEYGGTMLVESPDQRLLLSRPAVPAVELSYGSVQPATAASLGVGCAGSAGVPQLTAAAWQRPRIGEPFEAVASTLPASAPIVLVVLGFDTSSWNGQPLPLDLGALGMPGCRAFVRPDQVDFVAVQAGRAPWARTIPPDAALVGLSFHLQGLVPDPGINTAQATVTNALSCRIGAR